MDSGPYSGEKAVVGKVLSVTMSWQSTVKSLEKTVFGLINYRKDGSRFAVVNIFYSEDGHEQAFFSSLRGDVDAAPFGKVR